MSAHVKELNTTEFANTISGSKGLILVDFWAPWCGPCRMVGPVLEEVARDMAGKVSVFKLNVDENGEIAMKYGVSGIPTFILFKDGEIVARNVGAVPKATIETLINKHL